MLIVEHRLGFVLANAGIDRSNIDPQGASEPVLLLPQDPDASAAIMCERFARHFNRTPAVIITDSWGRAWRHGTTGVAIGVAGLPALMDLRGRPDLFGHRLRVTQTAFADEIACAASLIMGQANEGRPAVLVRGLSWDREGFFRSRADPLARGGPVPVTAQRSLVVALSGGVGGAKLVLGLSRIVPAANLVAIVNTADDFEHLGLSISPDLDSVMYALAGLDDRRRGWGRREETWTFMSSLAVLGGETWFQLGDGDLATHVERTRRRKTGEKLSDYHRRFLSPPQHCRACPADERRCGAHLDRH